MEHQEKLAREWAERNKACDVSSPEIQAAADFILANTAPPTMADVEWDSEKYYLAGAVDADGNEVVMLGGALTNIRVCDVGQMGLAYPVLESPKALTPNGKRYELREVGAAQPDHPRVLRTMEDYENAPGGTIVALGGGEAWFKGGSREFPWVCRRVELRNASMANTGREVLRWGWGK